MSETIEQRNLQQKQPLVMQLIVRRDLLDVRPHPGLHPEKC